MVCLFIVNDNENQEMGVNDVFSYLNKKCNENQNSGPHLKLKMINKVLVPMRGCGNVNLVP